MFQTKEKFDKMPRGWGLFSPSFNQKKNSLRKPKWVDRDPMNVIYKDEKALFKHGKIAIGALVQANSHAFTPKDLVVPGNVLFSYDEYYFQNPLELRSIASTIYSYKFDEFAPVDVKQFSNIIHDERQRAFNLELPQSLTGGRLVYFTTVMFEQRHLPGGALTHKVLPIIAAPDKTPASMILPAEYWCDDIKKG